MQPRSPRREDGGGGKTGAARQRAFDQRAPIDRKLAERTVEMIKEAGGTAAALSADLTKPAECKRMVEAAEPKWLRIGGYWYPRGGIPIDVFWQTGRLPNGVWLPEQGVPPYRGRG